jgi:two-component system, cell cycle sensor histidine kinase and response regulator CckA
MIYQHADATRQEHQGWEQALDAVPDLISIIDLEHTITRANKAMAERCGLTPEEIVGRKCYEVMHRISSAHANCPHARMLQIGRGCCQQIAEPGLNCVFDITVSPLYDAQGRMTASAHFAREVTERKPAEKECRLSEPGIQQVPGQEVSPVRTGGLGHDLNNILTVILGHCFMIKEGINAGMTDKEHAQQIEDAGNRAAELCQQMMFQTPKEQKLKAPGES